MRRLPQRPSYEAGAALNHRPHDRLAPCAEFRRVGPAIDPDPQGARAELPAGNEVSVRTRYRLIDLDAGHRLFLTASINDLADNLITPQLGLPVPGRSIRIGLQLD